MKRHFRNLRAWIIQQVPLFKRGLLIALSLAVFYHGIRASYGLLDDAMIESGDFVTLVITVVVASFALAFLSELSEVSIGGYVIKLREAKKEAEITIGQLQKLLEASFEPQLEAVKVLPGGFGDAFATKDSRVDRFSRLFDSIKKVGLVEALTPKIAETAEFLAKIQLKFVERFSCSDYLWSDVGVLPSPSEVAGKALDTGAIGSLAERLNRSEGEMKLMLEEALKAYRDMYELSRL